MNKDCINFVSLGPGNPDMITLKSLKNLQESDVIFCPGTSVKRKCDNGLLTDIKPCTDSTYISRAKDFLTSIGIQEERISVFIVPMEKEREQTMKIYRETAEKAIEEFDRGKKVSITVEGDASIYASIHYMMDYLSTKGIPVKQFCGIPSFIAATEPAMLHLISQEERMVVIPGNASEKELENYIVSNHVPVIMKLSRCKEAILKLIDSHPEYKYYYFENIANTDGKDFFTTEIDIIKKRQFPYFSLMIIRKE